MLKIQCTILQDFHPNRVQGTNIYEIDCFMRIVSEYECVQTTLNCTFHCFEREIGS